MTAVADKHAPSWRRYLDLLAVLTAKEIKVRYKRTALGYAWSLLNPIVYAVTFWFAFKAILNVKIEEVPHVPAEKRLQVHDSGEGFYRVVLHYGYMEEVDIPGDLGRVHTCGEPFTMMNTSFFLGRQKLIASKKRPGMALWREHLFEGEILGEAAQAVSLIRWNNDNRFCGRCGSVSEGQIGGYKRICTAC